MTQKTNGQKKTPYNSTYPKVAVHWLNQALYFNQSLHLTERESLRNRHLRVAAKRYSTFSNPATKYNQRIMEGQIFIDNSKIGIVNFKIIDETMGVIGGDFIASDDYGKFKSEIQKLTEKKGNANSQNFNFRIVVENIELNPFGGICLVDSEEFAEMYLDAAGISESDLKKVNI